MVPTRPIRPAPLRDNCFDCGQYVSGFNSIDPPNDDVLRFFTRSIVVAARISEGIAYRVECDSCGSEGPYARTPKLAVVGWNEQEGRRPK